MSLQDKIQSGDRLALSRLLSLLEDEDPKGLDILSALYSNTGSAHLIGITGSPGTGKSTLVNQLALELRKVHGETLRIAIVAVDPSSPFSGGAILGDRIRMRDLAGDQGIFIRSMASRGTLGGLAKTTPSIVDALDAAGYDVVLIETVGAGQAEVDIASTAHTTIVIDAPGLGDGIQAIKAGILEIADILVVNKSDLQGAEHTLKSLKAALELGYPNRKTRPEQSGEGQGPLWRPPVLPTIATIGDGLAEVVDAISKHRDYLDNSRERASKDAERMRFEIESLLRRRLAQDFLIRQPEGRVEEMLQKVQARELSPYQAVEQLLSEVEK
jgi:LAO/AO transport system kinase